MNEIVGRAREQRVLERIYKSQNAEFAIIYGRRRVGKTYLIRKYFAQLPAKFFQITGTQDGLLEEQLSEFAKAIGDTFYNGATISAARSWRQALEELTKAITNIASQQKIVLFFDEFPWLASKRSRLLAALDYYWNRYWVDLPNVKLIVCGSTASWMIKKLVHHKGGLHNRITQRIILQPFDLAETKEFLQVNQIKFNTKQILQIYLCLGGIPYYLKQLRTDLSATQNINQLCFQTAGLLFDEFEKLFASLFENSAIYIELITIIAQSRSGKSRTQISTQSDLAQNGGLLTDKLKDLEATGFIKSLLPLGNKKKGLYYKVIDEYCLFYLKWIKPITQTFLQQETTHNYWEAQAHSPAYHSWSGYAFEALCYKHIHKIRSKLNIPDNAISGAWQHIANSRDTTGAQIDLLFDRYDDIITLCEIKCTASPFVIDKAYYQQILNKISVYKKITKTTKQIVVAFISANGIKPTVYSTEICAAIVTIEDLL